MHSLLNVYEYGSQGIRPSVRKFHSKNTRTYSDVILCQTARPTTVYRYLHSSGMLGIADWVPTIRGNLSVPSSKVKQSKTPKDETGRLSRTVGN